MLRRDRTCAHMGANMGAHGAHTFDEDPCAFRKFLPLRAQSLNARCSTSGDLIRVHSDADFDENPCAILRFVHWHGSANLTAWDVHRLHHDGRTKSTTAHFLQQYVCKRV